MKGLLVTVEVSQSSNRYRFDWEQLDMTKEEFDALSYDEKYDVIQKAVNLLPEQPYWHVDDFISSND